MADDLGGKLGLSPLRSGESLQLAQFLRCKKTSKAKTRPFPALTKWLFQKFYKSAGCWEPGDRAEEAPQEAPEARLARSDSWQMPCWA